MSYNIDLYDKKLLYELDKDSSIGLAQLSKKLRRSKQFILYRMKKLEEAKEVLLKINDLKNEEDHQLDLWENTLVEIEKKVDFIDQSLNEPEQY